MKNFGMNNNLIQFNSFKDENITVEFTYNSQKKIPIYSKLNERFEEICNKFALKINKDISKIQFIYSGKDINTNNKLITLAEIINKIDNERKMMSIIALDISNESTIINKKNIYNLQNNQIINENNIMNNKCNFQQPNIQMPINTQLNNFKSNSYLFSKKGLKNIGSTCYMNATLQCLLHVNELITYFIEEYPKDQQQLAKINNDVASGGDISRAFFNLVIGVNENSELVMSKKNLKPKTKKKSGFNILGVFGFDNDYDDSSYDRAFAPTDFKRTLGIHNPQFKKFEANDSKDLILYLLQTMHEELNYYGNVNKRLKYIPNQYNIYETYNHFITNYNTNNFSKISLLFYGTYQNTTTCLVCRKKLYNFQKFEFISFGMYYYHKHKFNILNGFQDNANPTILKGDNKFLCNNCKKLQDAKTECKIFEPPLKLLINLDYGKNKKYQPSSIEFDEEIDITKFVEFDYKQKIRYRIIGVCTHYGHSGSYGHYVAFCRNTQTDTWYEFNDSFCSECNKREIYRGSPCLLLYERIFN